MGSTLLEEAPTRLPRRTKIIDRPVGRRAKQRLRRARSEAVRRTRALEAANRRLEAVQAEMREEMLAAACVQQSLLPSPQFSAPALDVAWLLRSCDHLGGDLLNCIRLDEHHVAFWVLDVAGHGVSAALLSVQISRLMSPLLSEAQILKTRLDRAPWYEVVQPDEVLRRLNDVFAAETDESGSYFTMVYGLLHSASGRLHVATGGHPPPLFSSGGDRARPLPCRGLPLGLLEEQTWETLEMRFEPGDRLWLFSDGVTESEDPAGRQFGSDGLADAVGRVAPQRLPQAVPDVMREVLARCDGRPGDDCSLLALERTA